MEMNQKIKAEALRLGFSHCGIALAEPLDHLRPFYEDYLARGKHQTLTYISTNYERRLNPELLLPGVKSVVALLMNYYPPQLIPEADNYIIAKYAWGKDYHTVMNEKMDDMMAFMEKISPGTPGKVFMDSGPVLEKTWAMRCGTGWLGKNTLLINRTGGSFYFIGIILTCQELVPDPPETDHCGACDRCIKACPTSALEKPYELNIAKCLSYQTLENKDNIPAEIMACLGDRIYGCDICQDVCPYNRLAKPDQHPLFFPSEDLLKMRKKDWEALTGEDFDRLFSDSGIKKKGYRRLMKNLVSPAK